MPISVPGQGMFRIMSWIRLEYVILGIPTGGIPSSAAAPPLTGPYTIQSECKDQTTEALVLGLDSHSDALDGGTWWWWRRKPLS